MLKALKRGDTIYVARAYLDLDTDAPCVVVETWKVRGGGVMFTTIERYMRRGTDRVREQTRTALARYSESPEAALAMLHERIRGDILGLERRLKDQARLADAVRLRLEPPKEEIQ